VTLIPWMDRPEAIWAAEDLCLVASADEGCPYNAIEAMACGRPAIVHRYEGAEDQFPREAIWTYTNEALDAWNLMDAWTGFEIRHWAAARYSIEANSPAVLSLFEETR